jgi:hypothetical protein
MLDHLAIMSVLFLIIPRLRIDVSNHPLIMGITCQITSLLRVC